MTVVEGTNTGNTWESVGSTCSVGSHPLNDLVVDDETVSRFHAEIRIGSDGARLRDVGSLNGVWLDGVQVFDALLRSGSLIRLGRTALRFDFRFERNAVVVSAETRFGELVGSSLAMRTCFALMQRAATSDVTLLLEGETGTGKSRAARSIHEASARKGNPFLVVDCGAIPTPLLESELFGHEKGSFTGATGRRLGVFEEAAGGTVFLDEIGELPAELQPKLLRVLEDREIRRVGSNTHARVDVRIIAATHRDLRAEVNTGRFRSDLFFRLAVLRIGMPALRERPDDLPSIVDELLVAMKASREVSLQLLSSDSIDRLRQSAWPGNVRELRNYLERCLVFQESLPVDEEERAAVDVHADTRIDLSVTYAEARRRALEQFERQYVKQLIDAHEGKVSQAASAADIDRVYLYRLMRKHQIRSPGSSNET